jgi:nitroreductase
MELIEALYTRRAIRSFEDKQVDKETISTLIHAAIQAPSAMNSQPWAFAVVQDRNLLRDYSTRAKTYALSTLGNEPHAREWESILSRPDYDIFHGAPTLIIICAKPDGLVPAEDCSLAAANLMLAAHAKGLGTCPIGFARLWLNLPEVKSELGIPANYSPVFPVVVGYQKGPAHPVERRAPEVLFWR